MSISNGKKTINKQTLDCGETATVSISFDAKSELKARPADIIVVLDESSSMAGEKLTAAKKGAKELVDLVTLASGGVVDGTIENKSRIGLVGFASTATPLVNLTNDSLAVKDAINKTNASGRTNHEDAFIKAGEMIDKQSTNDKIIIMFTDGISNTGGDASVQTDLLKQEGIEIYCIAFGTNITDINKWASLPLDNHVATTTKVNEIDDLFRRVAYQAIKAGATDVLLQETLNKDFKIVKVLNVNPGTVDVKSLQSLEWKMDVVGITDNDTATLDFEIQYIGNEAKKTNVNESLTYSDKEQNQLTFPNPEIDLTCNNNVILPDSCSISTSAQIDGCKDAIIIETVDATVQDLGRIVQVDVPIKNVCPNKRVGLAVLLTELDVDGVEHSRGMKTILISPIVSDKCENILVKCINFVVPESTSLDGNPDSLCKTRNFKVRTLVNYIDTDFVCCDKNVTIVQ